MQPPFRRPFYCNLGWRTNCRASVSWEDSGASATGWAALPARRVGPLFAPTTLRLDREPGRRAPQPRSAVTKPHGP
jgi:hypothetical protein